MVFQLNTNLKLVVGFIFFLCIKKIICNSIKISISNFIPIEINQYDNAIIKYRVIR